VIAFPGRVLPPDGYSEADIDKLHAETFRDLQGAISDFVSMGQIAAQLCQTLTTVMRYWRSQCRMLKAFKQE
jgi:hypothetical protein